MANDRLQATVTIKEVAEKAGVSTATVSRVLSGKDAVSQELTQRVLDAVEVLGYRINRAARELRAGSVQKVGVILADIQNPFFTSILAGIEKVLQKENYLLLLGNSNEDPDLEQLHLDNLLEEGVAGIIVAPTTNEVDRYAEVQRTNIPIIAVDRVPGEMRIDAVLIDNLDAAKLATEHLIRLGHQRIGFIGGPENLSTAIDRRKGYEQALQEHRIRLDPELVQPGHYRMDGGYQAMEKLLSLKGRPSAVFVGNYMMTVGALQFIHEHKLNIPEDIALVAFDDMPWYVSLQTPLTVVDQPTFKLGEIAAQLLVARVRDPEYPVQRIILEAGLVVRASSGAPVQNLDMNPSTRKAHARPGSR